MVGSVITDALRRWSGRTAIVASGVEYTYRELADLTARVGMSLDRLGAGSTVVLVTDRFVETYLCYLATVLSGRTVAPVHGSASAARVRGIAESLGASVVVGPASFICEDSVRALLECSVVAGEDLLLSQPAVGSSAWGHPTSSDHVYVLHTSGSTGAPKGVPISHASVLSYLDYVIERYEIGPGSRMSANFDLSFDLAVFDLLGSVLAGATLVLPDGVEALAPHRYAARGGLTHWFSVPSAISAAARLRALPAGSMPTLRWSLFCGEPLTYDQAAQWAAAAPGTILENLYGPTELTVSCAQYRLPADPSHWVPTLNGTVPIGEIYPHQEWQVADNGELLVRGPQRFGGYTADLPNAKAFGFACATGKVPEAAWYHTGDAVVQVPGHGLVHVGRLDRQVKVRGHRVELGEVEHSIRSLATGAEAAVVSLGDGLDMTLHALVAPPQARAALDPLADVLPRHAVPATVDFTEALPTNNNGKIDYERVKDIVQTRLAHANRSSSHRECIGDVDDDS